MKRILNLALVAFMLPITAIFAQDVSINAATNPSSIAVSQTGVIEINICNTDPNPLDAPANRLRPTISVPASVEIVEVTNDDGTPLTGWTIQAQSGSSVRLLNQVALPNFECFNFNIVIRGVSETASGNIIASLGFQGPQTPGNQTGNDNAIAVIAVEAAQPVTLTSFEAYNEDLFINLHWSTTMETNSDRFEVERSNTGKNWQKIGTVKSHGESNVLRNYDLTDANPVNGTNYYRLKMIDKDATYEYSRIVSTVFSGEVASLYPNPAVDYFKITKSINVGKVKITDLTGREIAPSKYELQADNQVKVKSMSAGLYLVSVMGENGVTSVHKLVIGK